MALDAELKTVLVIFNLQSNREPPKVFEEGGDITGPLLLEYCHTV